MSGPTVKYILRSSQFKKDYKKIAASGRYKKSDFELVLQHLIDTGTLPKAYKDHPLKGNFKGYRECHIKPDCLLIYKLTGDTLSLIRMGSHSDLFE
jgi:mRNA interferase YafQ